MIIDDFCDLALTENGDIVVQSGDILLRRGLDSLADQILFRLKTVKGDYMLEPDCGASLESVVGEPNTEMTGLEVEALVREALTADGLLNPVAVDVDAVPVSEHEIVVAVTVPGARKGPLVTASIDLREGSVAVQRL